jgi:hypothetical protein
LCVLAWINHSYEDDLCQATATAEHQAGPHQWHVSLRVLGEFWARGRRALHRPAIH